MKPVERHAPNDPIEWLNRARINLVRARTLIPNTYLEDACFDAQQAAEKAIKSVMILRGIDFPYIHQIDRLLDILEESGEPIPNAVRRAADLTQYAAATRYPGFEEPVTEHHHSEAIKHAQAVVAWAGSLF